MIESCEKIYWYYKTVVTKIHEYWWTACLFTIIVNIEIRRKEISKQN
jgi:hypothetical protein